MLEPRHVLGMELILAFGREGQDWSVGGVFQSPTIGSLLMLLTRPCTWSHWSLCPPKARVHSPVWSWAVLSLKFLVDMPAKDMCVPTHPRPVVLDLRPSNSPIPECWLELAQSYPATEVLVHAFIDSRVHSSYSCLYWDLCHHFYIFLRYLHLKKILKRSWSCISF